jgi:hypothetical protein
MIISRENWNKMEYRIGFNSSKYTKFKLKVILVGNDYTKFRECGPGESPDYIFKVKKDETGNLYFNYFHKQVVKTDILFADLDNYMEPLAEKKEVGCFKNGCLA